MAVIAKQSFENMKNSKYDEKKNKKISVLSATFFNTEYSSVRNARGSIGGPRKKNKIN